MYIHIGNRQYIQVHRYVRTLIKRKGALFHSQIRMYIQTNLTKIICTVQVLASIGNLCQQPGMKPHDADIPKFLTTWRVLAPGY